MMARSIVAATGSGLAVTTHLIMPVLCMLVVALPSIMSKATSPYALSIFFRVFTKPSSSSGAARWFSMMPNVDFPEPYGPVMDMADPPNASPAANRSIASFALEFGMYLWMTSMESCSTLDDACVFSDTPTITDRCLVLSFCSVFMVLLRAAWRHSRHTHPRLHYTHYLAASLWIPCQIPNVVHH